MSAPETLVDWLASMVAEHGPNKRWRVTVTHMRGQSSAPVGYRFLEPGDDVNTAALRILNHLETERGVFPGRQVYEVAFMEARHGAPVMGRTFVTFDDAGSSGGLMTDSTSFDVHALGVATALANSQRHVENLHRANLEMMRLTLANSEAQRRVDSERLARAEAREDKVSELYFKLMRADREFEATEARETRDHNLRASAFARLSQLAPLLLGGNTPIDPSSHPILMALTEFADTLTDDEIAGMVGHLPQHKQVAILEVIVRLKKAKAEAAEADRRH